MNRVDGINRGMDRHEAAANRSRSRRSKGKVSDEEWAIRVDLAAAYRMVAHYGWDDLIFTHLSARIPGPEHHFLLNPYNLMFEEVTASSLVKVDVNGNPVEPTPFITNPAGFTIHSAIHMAREDAHAVMHLHTPAGQAVSAHSEGLLPLTQTAMLIRGDLAFHDYEGVAVDLDERERLVADLGDKNAMILRNHGTLAVGKNVGECFVRLYFLERACQAQIMALSAGDSINNPPQGSPEITAQQGAGRAAARRQPARLAGAHEARPKARDSPLRDPPRWTSRTLSVGRRRGNEGRQRQRLSRARQGAAAAFPVRISRRRFLRRGDASAERRGPAGDRAAAAGAARRVGDRPVDRAVRAALGDAGRPGAGRPVRPLCAARRGAGGAGRGGGRRAVHPVDAERLLDRRSRGDAGSRFWFQLYIVKDRGFVSDMIARAQGGGLRRAAADRRPRRSRHALSRLSRRAVGIAARPGSRIGQVLRRPDWAWDVALRGRPHDHGQSRAAARHGRGARAT